MKTYKQWLKSEKNFEVSFLRDITEKELKIMYRNYQLTGTINPFKRILVKVFRKLEL